MQLIPESISTRKTTALDETWESRLALLRYSQLKIDFQNETNIDKLKMWLEMFGGTIDETVVNTFTIDEYRRLLQSIILLFKLSGTVKAIELIGYVLGIPVQVEKGFALKYDGTIKYNGAFTYDAGADYSNFIVTIRCNAYPADLNIEAFKTKFLLLFQIFNPIWIHIMSFQFPKSSLLIGLETSEVSIEPDFESGVVTYLATVPSERETISLTPKALSPTAIVKINGLPTNSSPALIPLNYGDNNVRVDIVDGDTESTYNLTITRTGIKSYLASVALTGGKTQPQWTPFFDRTANLYLIRAYTSPITATITKEDASATLQVTCNGTTLSPASSSGNTTVYRVYLITGDNLLSVKVISATGVSNDYSFTIKK